MYPRPIYLLIANIERLTIIKRRPRIGPDGIRENSTPKRDGIRLWNIVVSIAAYFLPFNGE